MTAPVKELRISIRWPLSGFNCAAFHAVSCQVTTRRDKMALTQLKKKYGFQPGAGYVETNLDAVRFFWSTEPVERAPLIYNAGLVLILQGQKIGYLGDRIFHYDTDHYLVLSVALPFDCATFASFEDPMLGLFIDINRIDLHELVPLLEIEPPSKTTTSLGLSPAPLDAAMKDAIRRLLDALCSDAASKALGPGILREIAFHCLQGPHGSALRALTQVDSQFERIAKTITDIRQNYATPLRIEDLAREAGMSEPVFHRAFKAITGASPHRYLKTTRLHRAKGLILAENLPVAEAARQVGYENAAHFSREFKKHFKVSPKDAQSAGYRPIDF